MRKSLLSLAIALAVTLAIGGMAATIFVSPTYSGPSAPPDSNR